MKKIITTVAVLLCCSAAYAQVSNPIVVVTPDGKIVQCINTGAGIVKCY